MLQNVELSENNCEGLYKQINSDFELMEKKNEAHFAILENTKAKLPFIINSLKKDIFLTDSILIKYHKFEKYKVILLAKKYNIKEL